MKKVIGGWLRSPFASPESYLDYLSQITGWDSRCIELLGEVPVQDALLLVGGEDIDPKLFSKNSPAYVTVSDVYEFSAAKLAMQVGMPLLGICRGSQMVCVANGGQVIQHVDGHALGYNGYHEIETISGQTFMVNSTHHQAAIPPSGAKILAWSTVEKERIPEVVYYPETKSLGIQCHPENFGRPLPPLAGKGFDFISLLIHEFINTGEIKL